MRGLTVLEFCAAMLALGALALLAMPSFKRYLDRTRTFKAVADIGAAGARIRNYWQDARAYPDTLADVGLGGLQDPWGRPYVYYNIDKYGKGHARKDHALNPLNTDFDLYSVGSDGVTKPQISQQDSLDDVIRARDGAFVGLAADF